MGIDRNLYAIRRGNEYFTGTTHGVFSGRHQPKLYTGLGVIRQLVSAVRGWRKDSLLSRLGGSTVVKVQVVEVEEVGPIEEVLGGEG